MDLPPEIMYEILANLPVKTLARFRSVCKPWNSLISNLGFQQDHHRRRSQQDPLLLLTTPGNNSLELSTHDIHDRTFISKLSITLPLDVTINPGVVKSCQGMVCFTFFREISLCNPSTREVILLPQVQGFTRCIGFGYVDSSKEFKVVRFYSIGNTRCCETFTLSTGKWKEARCPPRPHSRYNVSAPFLRGAVHLLSDSKNRDAEDAIYAFDIQSEEYTAIPLPECYYDEDAEEYSARYLFLYELNGQLCLTFNFKTCMAIWILKDYRDSKSWVKEYTINPPSLNSEFVLGAPLAIMRDGTLLLNVLEEEKVSGRVYWYNPSDGSFADKSMENHTATMYVDSLLPLGNGP